MFINENENNFNSSSDKIELREFFIGNKSESEFKCMRERESEQANIERRVYEKPKACNLSGVEDILRYLY